MIRLALVSLLCVLALGGKCPRDRQAAPAPTAQPGSVAEMPVESLDEKDLRALVARLQGQLGEARARLNAAENARLRMILAWVAGISILGMLACLVAMIWLPVLKKTLAMGALSFAAVLVAAVTLRSALPYLVWVGYGLLALGAVVMLPRIRKLAADAGLFDRDPSEAVTRKEIKK